MDIADAIAHLRRIYQADPVSAPSRDNDFEPLWGPVVIGGPISSENLLYLLETDEEMDQLRWEFEAYGSFGMGRVVLHSIRTPVHERITNAIVRAIRDQVVILGEDTMHGDALRRPASLVCELRDQLQAPDDALVPASASKASLPTLVVEVAFLNETLARLEERLARWLTHTTSVQIAIGVKVFSNARRTLVLMQRAASNQVIEFGGRGRASPVISVAAFPLHALFQGFTLPTALAGQQQQLIVIDPDHLRVVIQKAQRMMKRHGIARLGW